MENKRKSKMVIVWDEIDHLVATFPSYWEASFHVNRTSETVRRILTGKRKTPNIDNRYRVFYYSHEKLAELNNLIAEYNNGNNA